MDPDLFLSHATEDKDGFVRPLAHALTALGASVWYDEFSLRAGDSLRESIDRGLRSSRFGVVVLSEAFFGKPWTAWELNALVQRGLYSDEKVILPVWHGVDAERVRRFSASLADILALNSTAGVDQVAKQIWEIAAPAPTPDSAAPPSHVAPVINDEEVAEEVARALEAASEVFKARGGERPRITIFKMCPDGLVRVDTGEIRTDRARSATNPSSLIGYSSKLRKAITIGDTVAMNEAGFTPGGVTPCTFGLSWPCRSLAETAAW
jgi:hypothetical protein